jgi:hypothetical protein
MKNFIYSLIVCFSIQGFSQEFDLKWKTDENKKESIAPTAAIIKDNGELVSFNYCAYGCNAGNQKITITHFDKNLNVVKSAKKVPFKINDEDAYFENPIKLGNELYVIISEVKKKEDKKIVYLSKLTSELQQGETTRLGEMPYDKPGLFSLNSETVIDFISSNNKKFNVLYTKYNTKLSESPKYKFFCFDNEAKVLWENDIEIKDIKTMDYSNHSVNIANNGNISICYRQTTSRGMFGGSTDFDLGLIVVTDNGSMINKLKVDDLGKYLTQFSMDFDEHNNIKCVGFYSNKKGRDNIQGIINKTYDGVTFKETVSKSFNFNKPIYNFYVKSARAEKLAEKDKGLPAKYRIIQVYAMSDGSTNYISEYYDTYTVTMNRTTTTYFQYFDLIVINVDKNGEFRWFKPILKFQESSNTFGFGVFTMKKKDHIYIFFNDSKKNIEFQQKQEESGIDEKLKGKYVGNMKNASLVMKELDINGNMNTKIILDGEEQDAIINPNLCYEIPSEEKVIIYGSLRKKEAIGILDITKPGATNEKNIAINLTNSSNPETSSSSNIASYEIPAQVETKTNKSESTKDNVNQKPTNNAPSDSKKEPIQKSNTNNVSQTENKESKKEKSTVNNSSSSSNQKSIATESKDTKSSSSKTSVTNNGSNPKSKSTGKGNPKELGNSNPYEIKVNNEIPKENSSKQKVQPQVQEVELTDTTLTVYDKRKKKYVSKSPEEIKVIQNYLNKKKAKEEAKAKRLEYEKLEFESPVENLKPSEEKESYEELFVK